MSLKSAHNTTTPRPPVPCILQILTTFNCYSGRPRVGLSVNNKQKVRQAMVKISRGGVATPPQVRYVSRNGLTIGGLRLSLLSLRVSLTPGHAIFYRIRGFFKCLAKSDKNSFSDLKSTLKAVDFF